MTVIKAPVTVRDALMQSMALATSSDRAAWRAYRAALEAIGYVGQGPVSIDLERHAWALLTALERRAGLAREELHDPPPGSDGRAAWARMTMAEVALDLLGLSGGVLVSQPFDAGADEQARQATRRRARWQRARR
jgi:hypothetical protein